MKNIKLYLKINYWLIIICFFLPFMVDNCIHEQLDPGSRKHNKDSVQQVAANNRNAVDTVRAKIGPAVQHDKGRDSVKPQLSAPRKVYNLIMSPTEQSISGIGYIIYRTQWINVSAALCLLLTLISMIFIYRKNSRHKLLFIFSVICFLFCFIFAYNIIYRWQRNQC